MWRRSEDIGGGGDSDVALALYGAGSLKRRGHGLPRKRSDDNME